MSLIMHNLKVQFTILTNLMSVIEIVYVMSLRLSFLINIMRKFGILPDKHCISVAMSLVTFYTQLKRVYLSSVHWTSKHPSGVKVLTLFPERCNAWVLRLFYVI